jgi:hypothetical protein
MAKQLEAELREADATALEQVSGPLRPCWRPFWLRFTYVPPVLVTKY